MSEAQASSGRKPSLTFVLVHGTFGRDAPWVTSEKEGSFRNRLRRELGDDYDVRFEVVKWGEPGRIRRYLYDNTLGRRFAGAVSLVQRLSQCDDASDTDRRYLVAHSHGGSVVMYAMTNPTVLDKISGVVCLSSPFLRYREVKFNRDLLFFSAAVLLIVAADVGNAPMWIYSSFYALVVGIVLLTQNFGESNESRERLKQQMRRVKLPTSAEFRNTAGPIPFLAVRPHRDEVTGLFWFTQNAGRAFRALWQFVNTIGRWALYAFFLVRLIEWAIETVLPDADMGALDGVMSAVDQRLMTPIMLVATAVLLGMVVMRLSYAFDALPWLAPLDPRPKILPWDTADAVAVDTFGLLAHTSVPSQAPPKIAEWIRRSHQVDPAARITPPASTAPSPSNTDTPAPRTTVR